MIGVVLSLLLALAPVTPDGGVVTAKGQRFLAEVARTPQEQARGLMYRTNLAKDRCMFFYYEADGPHSIWMKNCLIALDVVWVDAAGSVVELAEKVPPCSPLRGDDCPSYGGNVDARHFVEFPAGTIRRLALKKGDRLGWKLNFSDGQTVTGGAQGPAPAPTRKGRRK